MDRSTLLRNFAATAGFPPSRPFDPNLRNTIMARIAKLAASLLVCSIFHPAVAQRSRSMPQDDRVFGGASLPAAGTLLPIVTAVDAQGNGFSTASLRGSYTVLVFGCLT